MIWYAVRKKEGGLGRVLSDGTDRLLGFIGSNLQLFVLEGFRASVFSCSTLSGGTLLAPCCCKKLIKVFDPIREGRVLVVAGLFFWFAALDDELHKTDMG